MNKGELSFSNLNSVSYSIHVTMQTAFQVNELFFLQNLDSFSEQDWRWSVLYRVVFLSTLLPMQSLWQITQNWEWDEEPVWRTPPVFALSPSISSYPIPVTLLTCSFFLLASSALHQHPIPSSVIQLRHDRSPLKSPESLRARCHLDGKGDYKTKASFLLNTKSPLHSIKDKKNYQNFF